MAEWKTDGEWGAKFDAPGIHRIARPTGDFELWFGDHLLEGDGRTRSLDAAKTAAEQALREMHDALSAHFAPVLRWNDGRAELKELGWKLWAYSSGYTLQNTRTRIEGRCVQLLTEDENRSAAETALRAMGVVFRTEGE